MDGLLGPKLACSGDATREKPTSEALQGAAVVAIYFSAHWCGPCKMYTPELRKVYNRCKAQGKAFEVVFVSGDRDDASFKAYFSQMPWHAVPFVDRARQQTLSMAFGVKGIPSLVLLTGSGSVIDANAKSKVVGPGFPSTVPRVIDMQDVGPVPSDPVNICIRHNGREFELECDPEDLQGAEGWEILRMQIFSVTEVPVEQQRLFGLGVPAGPLCETIPLARAVARGIKTQQGSISLKEMIANVPEESRKASSTHGNDAIGKGHHRGRLDSPQGWSAVKDDAVMRRGEMWYQMDLGSPRPIRGVVVAARADCPQNVTRFKVSYADQESGPWTFVGGDAGTIFSGTESIVAPPKLVEFPGVLTTRLVRIFVVEYVGHPSLRADVALQVADEQASKPELRPTIVVLGNASADDPFEVAGPAATPMDANAKMIQEQHAAFLQVKLSSAPPRLQQQVNSYQHVLAYEDRGLQRQALDEIPVCMLDELARNANAKEGYEVAFMRQVLRWFKFDFFTWMNKAKCEHCGSRDTQSTGQTQANQLEQSFGAGVVETYQCSTCGMPTRFPRYNDPAKLLETKTGRCGEWANCFTLVCRALGYEARHVHDWTDHVWTEIYSDSLGRWVHADSCEAALDAPLLYEKGWGKKLNYCLAFARDNVCDVTRRYTQKFDEVKTRRSQFSEQQLVQVLRAIDEFAMERTCSALPAASQGPRREALERRAEKEAKEFTDGGAAAAAKPAEQVGRTSGDREWREQRGELGADASAKAKAIECSEKGVADVEEPTLAAKPTPPSGDSAAAAEARTGSGGYPSPAATASGTSPAQPCATPPQSKEQAQALVKAKFAELVASGLSPTEAAAKAMQEVKQQMNKQLAPA